MSVENFQNKDKNIADEKLQTAADLEKTENIEEQSVQKPYDKENSYGTSVFYDIVGLLIRIAWIGIIFAFAFMLVVGITVNRGNRMVPAFYNEDIVVFYRLAHNIETGECVVYVGEGDNLLLGRVVAKEGDTVDITADGLMINGYYRTESYATGDTVLFDGGVIFPVTLSQGEYFVLCDNRSEGNDSRIFGALSSEQIKGRVLVSIRHRDF